MQGTEFVVKATVCFAIGGVNISTINSYLASVGNESFSVAKTRLF